MARVYFQLERILEEDSIGAARPEPQRFRELAKSARRDRDASRAAVAILRAGAHVSRAIERALAEAGLTRPQFNILMELAATPGAALPLHDLNARLIATPPNTSWLTNRMQGAGLVTKARSEQDARVVVLAMTESGWATLERALPQVVQVERHLLAGHTRDELRALAEVLGRFTSEA
jgi:DNA-binding MarR family transcriptional regulator